MPGLLHPPNHCIPADQRVREWEDRRLSAYLETEGWGNDVPTASGLVNSGGRQMNVDLAHSVTDGFELIELKLESNTPYDAALQILRYGAVYMLYRVEPGRNASRL